MGPTRRSEDTWSKSGRSIVAHIRHKRAPAPAPWSLVPVDMSDNMGEIPGPPFASEMGEPVQPNRVDLPRPLSEEGIETSVSRRKDRFRESNRCFTKRLPGSVRSATLSTAESFRSSGRKAILPETSTSNATNLVHEHSTTSTPR